MKKTTIFFVLFCCVFSLMAQVINIPADFSTIQAGIDAASSGDTVLVEEDTYIENIDFKGRAITVASRFIIDGDTSHISKTIIDGSQPSNPDAASVVTFRSGEDTTSVITGFTITGGAGTKADNILVSYPTTVFRSGGGIFIYHSGGKITHNIIEENHLVTTFDLRYNMGSGLLAREGDNQAVIIRGNIIRNNSQTGQYYDYGGGAGLIGGRFLVEHNSILNNTLDNQEYSRGAGMFISILPGPIEEAVFRNNIISNNNASGSDNHGGGVALVSGFQQERVEVYNNVISENYAESGAGGILFSGGHSQINVFNNTIINNEAAVVGNSLGFFPTSDILMYNNIIWAEVGNEVPGIHFWQGIDSDSLYLYYNILDKPFGPEDPVTTKGNTYFEPLFETDSYEPADTSPAIGRGVDSVLIYETWYVAPTSDFAGNTRPNGIDPFVDLGAFESGYEPKLLPNADLAIIGFRSDTVTPAFQKDILEYALSVADTTTSTTALRGIPADMLAGVDINYPTDLTSDQEADRTATITVSSSDGTSQKTYTVLFIMLSTDATLAALSASLGTLVPEFDPEVSSYIDTLPFGTTETPVVSYTTSNAEAIVEVIPATDVTSNREPTRKTKLMVTAEYGWPIIEYSIVFNVAEDNTGIETESDTDHFALYPNPFSTSTTLQLKENMKVHRIELLNMLGETVRVIDHTRGNRVVIERGGLYSGLYFLRVQSD